MRKMLFIFFAIVLAACSAFQPKSDFEGAREKWRDANISHYRLNVHVGCFCAFTENMPLVIEVKNGEVVSMEYQSGNAIDPSSLELFQRYAIIDKLFEEIEKDQNGEADKVTIEYDETYGFPTKIDIDFIEQAVDDEVYLTISGFEPLP